MDQPQTTEGQKSWSAKNTILTVCGVIVIAIIVGYAMQSSAPQEESTSLIGTVATSSATSTEEIAPENSTLDLQSDLESIDTGDIEQEFQSIDADLQKL